MSENSQNLSDKELQSLLGRIREDLNEFPDGMGYLDVEFESSAKHIPAYLKIVKGHIDQLADVLELENHNRRKLDSAGLAEPVTQLIQLFQHLDEQDISLLETLASEARAWQQQASPEAAAPTRAELATSQIEA